MWLGLHRLSLLSSQCLIHLTLETEAGEGGERERERESEREREKEALDNLDSKVHEPPVFVSSDVVNRSFFLFQTFFLIITKKRAVYCLIGARLFYKEEKQTNKTKTRSSAHRKDRENVPTLLHVSLSFIFALLLPAQSFEEGTLQV